jgi:hypothetical protein
MRVSSVSVHAAAGWPGVQLEAQGTQLTAICGPSNSGKSAMAGLIGHALFGKSRTWLTGTAVPQGELVVEDNGRRYRLRRAFDSHQEARLTVAALDGTPVDRHTTHSLVGNLSPSVLAPLCAVSFRESPRLAHLLSKEFALGIQSIHDDGGPHGSRGAAQQFPPGRVARQNLPRDVTYLPRSLRRGLPVSGGRAASWKRGGGSSIGWHAISSITSARWSSDCSRLRSRWRRRMLGCGIVGWN